MTRNLKVLGLALVAAFAMSALAASAAQAVPTFTGWETTESNHVHTTFKSKQKAEFGDAFRTTTEKPPVKCKTASGTGTSTTGDDTTVTLAFVYSTNCTANGVENSATIEPTSCHLKFSITAKHTEHEYTGAAQVLCTTPGDSIHITAWLTSNHAVAPTCDLTIDEQSGITGITYKNVTGGAKKTVEVISKAHNIKVTVIKGGVLCGESTGVNSTEGTFEGTDIVECFNSVNTQINCTISG